MSPVKKQTDRLEHLIKRKILNRGPISFSEFMNLALYHSPLGYYSKNRLIDDYYTNADVHSIFSETLARFFFSEWQKEYKDLSQFTLIELGCGNGKLAVGILQWAYLHAPEFYQTLRYIGIEISESRRQEFDKLKSIHGAKITILSEFGFPGNSFNGIIFSNEFFDALPFHRIVKEKGKIKEIFVGYSKTFIEELRNPSAEVREYMQWLGTDPAEGCIAEVHVECRNWMKKISKALSKGMILTIDYGYDADELYSEIRTEGTALCHSRHTTNRNFYDHLGDQDITAHVNFTTLIKESRKWGVKSLPLKSQTEFFLENGFDNMVQTLQKIQDAKQRIKTSSAIKSLIHPEGMGGTFKVLIQKK